jgi:hypothetical protein
LIFPSQRWIGFQLLGKALNRSAANLMTDDKSLRG